MCPQRDDKINLSQLISVWLVVSRWSLADCPAYNYFRALMFTSSKFGRKMHAINITQEDSELLSRVNAELQQYIANMEHVKYVEFHVCMVIQQ